MNLAYYIFLLLIIFLSFFILRKNYKYSPKKIKIYLAFIITLFLLRHIALLALCALESSKYIYYLKPIIYLDHITIPLMVLAITYVYQRSETLKFTGSYIILAIALIIYIVLLRYGKVTVEVSHLYGYIVKLNNETYIFLYSLILLGIMMVANVLLLDQPFVNKKGIWLIIFSIVVVMMEEVIVIGGIKLFPYSVIGEFIFLIIINFVINGFKKIRMN